MNSTEYSIRFLKENEWELLKDLRLEALSCDPEAFWDTLEETTNFEDEYWFNLSQELTKKSGSRMFICENAKTIIGFVYGIRKDESNFSLGGLWITPKLRADGFGKILVQEVIKWAMKETPAPILKIWSPKDSTTNFYSKLGFLQLNNEKKNPVDGRKIVEMEYELF